MADAAATMAMLLTELNQAWQPHAAQIPPLRAIFRDGKLFVFNECGRKYGKSEIFAYVLWRWGLTRPGAYYYFAPFQKQAREIVWSPKRLQTLGPKKYIKRCSDAELRLTLSGPFGESFIKVDGSDNFDAYRGVNPHGVVLDEFKDFRPEFWIAMEPNLATFEAQCLFAGTPPEVENEQFEALAKIAKDDGSYFNFPSWSNPHINRTWLRNKKKQLYAREEGVIWEREYGARRVFGGPGAIIPMFDRRRHVRPHGELMEEIYKDRHKLTWLVVADPGTAVTFGVLFIAVNPYSKKVYVLDEIYEEDQLKTTTSNIIPRAQKKKLNLYPEHVDHEIEWIQVYDEAATWFCTEAIASFNEPFVPTHKKQVKKDSGLSLIKDQFLKDMLVISDRCEKLAWEIENYVRDKNGKIPKERDHLIDCLRYGNAAAGLSLMEEDEPVDGRRANYRAMRPEQEIDDLREEMGFTEIDETDFDFVQLEFTP